MNDNYDYAPTVSQAIGRALNGDFSQVNEIEFELSIAGNEFCDVGEDYGFCLLLHNADGQQIDDWDRFSIHGMILSPTGRMTGLVWRNLSHRGDDMSSDVNGIILPPVCRHTMPLPFEAP